MQTKPVIPAQSTFPIEPSELNQQYIHNRWCQNNYISNTKIDKKSCIRLYNGLFC